MIAPGTYTIYTGAGFAPTLPPAGVTRREDILFNPAAHLLPGEWGYNKTDRLWFVASSSEIITIPDELGYGSGEYEPDLGNPAADGYILSSTAAGERSWIAPPEGGGVSYHNSLSGIQGGATDDYYHLTANLYNAFEYVPNSGNPYLRVKLPIACDYEIQAWSDFSQFPPTIWESMPLATSSAIGGIQLGSGSSLFLREDGTWQSVAVSSHDHDDRYSLLSHIHDSRYYTESEIDSLLSGKSDTSHLHDSRYYTKTEMTTLLGYKANINTPSFNGAVSMNSTLNVTGKVTAGSFGTANFTIVEESGIFKIKYGSTTILTLSSAGYLRAKDEIESFATI